jgi:predicted DCC family thiol-disulfide oxidoreductase YuxK
MTRLLTPHVRQAPLSRITVLFDAQCQLCQRVSGWLANQRSYIAVDLIPAGSPRARNRFPELDHEVTLQEITVVGSGGEVYTGANAWITCLWALRAYRGTANRLATPAGLPLARAAVLAAAKLRTRGDNPYGPPGEVCDARCRPAGQAG